MVERITKEAYFPAADLQLRTCVRFSVRPSGAQVRREDRRREYLDQMLSRESPSCGQRESMRCLKAHNDVSGFLQEPEGKPAAMTGERPGNESPGTIIGPYKLLQQIGEGGMGIVYMAEQQVPVRRKVALKIIKPGMDSREVIARFEAERQALAMMDHVNIAKVLEAGTTDTGRPYFVMELVHGVSITKYCDDNKLTPRQRLELFIPICQAVQHAHQKGIIHRDIKPSNVMVTMYDDKPVPKIIDFGVAKAIEQRFTEKTLFTQYGALVGTFEYMSPEQADLNAFGVDTRSDIYSLGVLLYELLTGTTPLDRQQLREAGFGRDAADSSRKKSHLWPKPHAAEPVPRARRWPAFPVSAPPSQPSWRSWSVAIWIGSSCAAWKKTVLNATKRPRDWPRIFSVTSGRACAGMPAIGVVSLSQADAAEQGGGDDGSVGRGGAAVRNSGNGAGLGQSQCLCAQQAGRNAPTPNCGGQ